MSLAQRTLPAVVQGILLWRQPVLVLDVRVPVRGKNLHTCTTRKPEPGCRRNIFMQTKLIVIRNSKQNPRSDRPGATLQPVSVAVS